MGIGKKFKRAVKKAGGGTRILSYVAPVTALATTKGRQQVMKTYGPILRAGSSFVGGGTGGAAATAALESLTDLGNPQSYDSITAGMRQAQGGGEAPAAYAPQSSSRLTIWLAAAAAAVVVVVAITFRRK